MSNLRTKEFNNNLNRLNHSASSSNNIKNGTNAGSSSISSELKKVLEATTRELHLKSKSCEELKSKYSSVQSNLSHTINELKKSIFGSVIDEISIETILDLDIPLLELPIMKKIDSISKVPQNSLNL